MTAHLEARLSRKCLMTYWSLSVVPGSNSSGQTLNYRLLCALLEVALLSFEPESTCSGERVTCTPWSIIHFFLFFFKYRKKSCVCFGQPLKDNYFMRAENSSINGSLISSKALAIKCLEQCLSDLRAEESLYN